MCVAWSSRESFASQYELDLTVDYRLRRWHPWLDGLWLRLRLSTRELEGAERDSRQVRLIVNYELPLL